MPLQISLALLQPTFLFFPALILEHVVETLPFLRRILKAGAAVWVLFFFFSLYLLTRWLVAVICFPKGGLVVSLFF
jgi:hypothetical protein